jgi:hypothetical protein
MTLTSLSPVQVSLPLVCLDAMRLMGKYCPAEVARKQILPMVFNVHAVSPGGEMEDKEGKEDKENKEDREDKNRRGKQQRKS